MYRVEPIPRASVAADVAATLRAMILDGRLADGERINEVKLSAALGVSRTPLREALNRLASEGALRRSLGHGHTVAPLTADEFSQLYDVRPILDPAALALCPLPSPDHLGRLAALNAQLQQAPDGESAIDLDDDWHLLLLADCPNRVLVGLIETMMARTRRYELALLRERPWVLAASTDHARILAALGQGDRDGACALLRQNLQNGKAPVLDWLARRG